MNSSLNILVLGGTEFLGRHFVNEAVKKGHSLTLFHRGKTNPGLFPDIENIIGDREGDLSCFDGRGFDAVLDTCGYFPQNMQTVTEKLKDQTQHYVFVSSCSVYDHSNKTVDQSDEDAPLVDWQSYTNDKSMASYGQRKYLCEEVVRQNFPDNHLVVRPGLIAGPHDPTYRFSYWADRISEGGKVLAPGDPEAPLQFIDVRDLSQWILSSIENRLHGTFNTVSPNEQLTLGEFLAAVKATVNPDSEIQWVPEDFLKAQEVSCWSQLPLWVYEDIQLFLKVNPDKAISQGLRFRPLEESIKDTHEWTKEIYREKFLNKVLSRKKEQDVLERFSEQP